MEIVVARSLRRRLLGLALRRRPPDGWALLFPRCRSVHTVGMRFAIDVVFLDCDAAVWCALCLVCHPDGWRAAGTPWRRSRSERARVASLPPWRKGSANRFVEALDPRTPIYRDTYNEYFVFLLSAGGAIAGTQVPLYILMAITGLWGLIPFVAPASCSSSA